MTEHIWYYRYLRETTELGQAGQFWGETDQPGDDPACEYTLVPPIAYNTLLGEHIVFDGQGWTLITPPQEQS